MSHVDTSSHVRLRSCQTAVARLFLLILAVFAFNAPSWAEGPRSVAPLAKKLSGAVVNISTAQKLKGPSGVPLPNVPDGSPFEDLFKDFFNKKGQPKRRSRKVSSLGSGFVIDGEKGLIVTNNHVIDGADEITVNFKDGRKLKVDKVLGKDPKTDLALLKVTPKTPLPSVKFGSSDKLEVGDWVLAIGNPFGLGGSVSIGIISAKERDIQSGPYDNYLQTDAAINKGNSGGPLFNMDGDVIGVNTAIISPTGGSIGIGFAVPADIALPIIDQLMKYGETRRGWLGVNIQSITEDLAASLGVPDRKGALVSSVRKGSPADKGGLKAGDVILKFDDRVVANMRALPRIVARTAHGKEVNVDIIRKGNPESLKIVVGRLDEGGSKKKKVEKKKSSSNDKEPTGKAVLGMSLAVLDDALRKKYKLSAKKRGLVVTEVTAGSPAAAKLLAAGQVIVAADQKPMFKLSDLVKAVESIKERGRPSILLRVEDSSGNLRFVALPVS